MAASPLAVPFWPDHGADHDAGTAPAPNAPSLLLAAVATPHSQQRHQARRLTRRALQQILGARLGCPPEAIALSSVPGQPLRLQTTGELDDSAIGLSLSHEAGLSLLAIHLAGPVGIDLLQLPPAPAWAEDIPRLAADYLGPARARQLARMQGEAQAGDRVAAFAARWTQLEACLKCLGLGLEEWSPALQHKLDGCRCWPLHLPPGYVGAVAIPARR